MSKLEDLLKEGWKEYTRYISDLAVYGQSKIDTSSEEAKAMSYFTLLASHRQIEEERNKLQRLVDEASMFYKTSYKIGDELGQRLMEARSK